MIFGAVLGVLGAGALALAARDPLGWSDPLAWSLGGRPYAVARIEPGRGRVLYCGIGNISGFLIGDGPRRALLSAPGIVGAHMRRLRTFEEPLPDQGALVMHSDGLTERWDHAALPGLLGHSPLVVAGHLLREAGVRRDDASVVVVKGAW